MNSPLAQRVYVIVERDVTTSKQSSSAQNPTRSYSETLVTGPASSAAIHSIKLLPLLLLPLL